MSDVFDKLKDPKALQAELDKRGIKMKVSDAQEELEELEFTDAELQDPKLFAKKLNEGFKSLANNIRSTLSSTVNGVKQEVKEESTQKELQKIRNFIADKKFVSPNDKDSKNQEVIDLMDFYYAKGDSLEDAYNKACKAQGLTGGVIGNAEDNKANGGKKTKETSPKQNRSDSHVPGAEEEEGEEESGEKKPKTPVSVRAVAGDVFDSLLAETKDAGKENPFDDKD